MQNGKSTHSAINSSNYIWTTYEWMHKNIIREIRTIVNFLGVDVSENRIIRVCEKHSFKNRYGRNPGDEHRKNQWGRKGIIGDWENWFDNEMLQKTQEDYDKYLELLEKEEINEFTKN